MPEVELARPARRRSDGGAECHHEHQPCDPPRSETVFDALGDASGVAALFPAVRARDGALATFARRGVPEFDARASATTWILGEALKLLDPAERQRVFVSWRMPTNGRSASLVVDGGCDVRISSAVVTGALRVAILEWLPLSRVDLAAYEGGLFGDAPADALALLVRPPTIWSVDEAVVADGLFPRGPRFEPERFDALERHARGRLRGEHLERLRAAATRIEAQLPVEGFPRASATVAAGCAAIAADDDWCVAIAARQLARYATSARVAREARARERSRAACAS